MKFSFKFSNLLGTVYKQGDLLFTPDGNSVISPVGNRITIFDLRNNKSCTLPIESRYNYCALDLSPNGCTLIAINEQGDAHMISLISQTVVHRYRFKQKVNAVKFSPDGKHFAVCKGSKVFVFKAPGPFTGEYNAFIMERVFHGNNDETTCLDWSDDSKVLAVGSKDMFVKLYPLDKWSNFKMYTLGSHTDSIVGCFFEKSSLDISTLSENGQLCIWESSMESNDFQPVEEPITKKQRQSDELVEDDIDASKIRERTEEEVAFALKEMNVHEPEIETNDKLFYKRIAKHYLADKVRKENRDATLTAAAYHKGTRILITGYSNGSFFVHEMPDVNMIHSLSISEQKIASISLNKTADWIALGCGGLGQLLVWEWQSETYVMKQQGHSNNMSCVAYSTDGLTLATGGEDGKVKLWNVNSGHCFVTFTEHSSAISSIAFSGNKKFVVSASLDGTVRCYDVIRYRNFRTLTSPRPVQLATVAVDTSGEFIAAGGQDIFEIFLWSLKLGRLLEILTGHQGPIGGLAFSPSPGSTMLASVSWDKTLRVWDAIEKQSAHESIELLSDGVAVAFKPDGQEVAVATLNGQINCFNVRTAEHTASIEGRNDLGSGRSDADLVTAQQSLKAKSFTTLCYSADGNTILAGGQSKNVCIYNVKEGIIIKKFEITQNRSFDAVDDFINRRKLSEFGNIALVEEREELEGGNVAIRLPGVRKGNMAARILKPEVRVFHIQFSPTGQAWAAATTEGLLIYSLTTGLVFDPWDLQLDITPQSVRKAITEREHLNAICGQVQNLNVEETDTELLVTWDHPANDGLSVFCGRFYFIDYIIDDVVQDPVQFHSVNNFTITKRSCVGHWIAITSSQPTGAPATQLSIEYYSGISGTGAVQGLRVDRLFAVWTPPENSQNCILSYRVDIANELGETSDITNGRTFPLPNEYCLTNTATVSAIVFGNNRTGQPISLIHTKAEGSDAPVHQFTNPTTDGALVSWRRSNAPNYCQISEIEFTIVDSKPIPRVPFNPDEVQVNATFTDLHPDMDYWYTAKWILQSGAKGISSDPVRFKTAGCGQVQNLTVKETNTELLVTWEPPVDNGSPLLCGIFYYIDYIIDGVGQPSIDPRTTNKFTIMKGSCVNHWITITSSLPTGARAAPLSIEYYSGIVGTGAIQSLRVEGLSAVWTQPENSHNCILTYRVDITNELGETSELTGEPIFPLPNEYCLTNNATVSAIVLGNNRNGQPVSVIHTNTEGSEPPVHQFTNPTSDGAVVGWRRSHVPNYCQISEIEFTIADSPPVPRVPFNPDEVVVNTTFKGLPTHVDFVYTAKWNLESGMGGVTSDPIRFQTVPLSTPIELNFISLDDGGVNITWRQLYNAEFVTEHRTTVESLGPNHLLPEGCPTDVGAVYTYISKPEETVFQFLESRPHQYYQITVSTIFGGLGMETSNSSVLLTPTDTPGEVTVQQRQCFQPGVPYDVTTHLSWSIPCDINGPLLRFDYKISGRVTGEILTDYCEIQFDSGQKFPDDHKSTLFSVETQKVKPCFENTLVLDTILEDGRNSSTTISI